MQARFNWKKATEVLLYIAKQVPNMYTALKVLYFADKEHLSRYGRLICGESYVAMKAGPVPSGTYDLVKFCRGDGTCSREARETVSLALEVDGYNLRSLRPANEDLLSESDMECLDFAINKYGRLTYKRLVELSHKEPAYQHSDVNDFIPLEGIIDSLPNSEELKDHLRAS